jgi:hypothetical protein
MGDIGVGDEALMMGAPEVGIPLEIGKQLAPHAPAILMVPLIMFALLFIIIGIIAVSFAANKTPGALFMVLGFLMAGAGIFVIVRTEVNHARSKKTN